MRNLVIGLLVVAALVVGGGLIAQSAYQFFEIAALHLSIVPPQLDQARLAIDAFGLLVEGLGDRLGEPAAELRQGLQQLRVTYVTVAQQGQPPAE